MAMSRPIGRSKDASITPFQTRRRTCRQCPVSCQALRSLTVVGQYLFASSAQLSSMLLKTSQNSEVSIVQHRPAVPLDIAGTSALFLLSTAMLRKSGVRTEERQKSGSPYVFRHGDLRGKMESRRPGPSPKAEENQRPSPAVANGSPRPA